MKRLLVVFILVLALILTGCSGVSEEDHNAVVTERDQLKAQLAELQADYTALEEEMDAKTNMREILIRGSFSATVQEVLPNYVLDGETPWFAVVTQYLDDPVLLNLGEEFAAQVEEGKIYVFTIEEKRVEAAVEKAWEAHSLTAYRGFEIKSVRLAEEDEMGVAAPTLEYIFADEL